jgi:hypothetical protein
MGFPRDTARERERERERTERERTERERTEKITGHDGHAVCPRTLAERDRERIASLTIHRAKRI